VNFVTMVIAESEAVNVRIFFNHGQTAKMFADWISLNGFQATAYYPVKMDTQIRTDEEQALASALWKSYATWRGESIR
jgi:hypothetical protein